MRMAGRLGARPPTTHWGIACCGDHLVFQTCAHMHTHIGSLLAAQYLNTHTHTQLLFVISPVRLGTPATASRYVGLLCSVVASLVDRSRLSYSKTHAHTHAHARTPVIEKHMRAAQFLQSSRTPVWQTYIHTPPTPSGSGRGPGQPAGGAVRPGGGRVRPGGAAAAAGGGAGARDQGPGPGAGTRVAPWVGGPNQSQLDLAFLSRSGIRWRCAPSLLPAKGQFTTYMY